MSRDDKSYFFAFQEAFMVEHESPVDEYFRKSTHIRKIIRRSKDDSICSQKFFRELFHIILEYANTCFFAMKTSDAFTDVHIFECYEFLLPWYFIEDFLEHIFRVPFSRASRNE